MLHLTKGNMFKNLWNKTADSAYLNIYADMNIYDNIIFYNTLVYLTKTW